MTENIRLAFLANGQSVHTEKWLRYFVGRGYDVHLITFTAKPIKGVKIHELRYFGKLDWVLRWMRCCLVDGKSFCFLVLGKKLTYSFLKDN